MDLIEAALRRGKEGFGQISKLIDELTAKLKDEQAEHDKKKNWCEAELNKIEDTVKTIKQDISDLDTTIDDAEGFSTNLKVEIETLNDDIKALDKEVEDTVQLVAFGLFASFLTSFGGMGTKENA